VENSGRKEKGELPPILPFQGTSLYKPHQPQAYPAVPLKKLSKKLAIPNSPSTIPDIATYSKDAKVWWQKWLFVEMVWQQKRLLVWRMQKCGSRTGCSFEGCKSVIAEMALCWNSMAAETAAGLKDAKVWLQNRLLDRGVAAEMAPYWEWYRSKNSCLFEGCKSVTAKLAPC
jgi:hypothetical protein